MFPTRYFADRYFAPRYFPKVGAVGVAAPDEDLIRGGIGGRYGGLGGTPYPPDLIDLHRIRSAGGLGPFRILVRRKPPADD